MGRPDLFYVQEKMFQAIDCLASDADLAVRLEYASDFVMCIQIDHFPKSEDGKRQLAKFITIRDRLLAAGVATSELAIAKLTEEQQLELSHSIVGLAFDVMGFIGQRVPPRATPHLKVVK